MSVNETHTEKETLSIEVNIPGHDARVTTSLFTRTRKELIEREGGRCFVCGRNAEESGHPPEAHHHPIERSFAEMIDWGEDSLIRKDYPNFNWEKFDPKDPYSFVDDMTVNGLLLCKAHHIGKNEGIHAIPYPIWLAQRYGREGYEFSSVEILHHESE